MPGTPGLRSTSDPATQRSSRPCFLLQEVRRNSGTFDHLPLGLTIPFKLSPSNGLKAPYGKEVGGVNRFAQQFIAAIEELICRGTVAGFPEHKGEKWKILDAVPFLKIRFQFKYGLLCQAAKFSSAGLVAGSPTRHCQKEQILRVFRRRLGETRVQNTDGRPPLSGGYQPVWILLDPENGFVVDQCLRTSWESCWMRGVSKTSAILSGASRSSR